MIETNTNEISEHDTRYLLILLNHWTTHNLNYQKWAHYKLPFKYIKSLENRASDLGKIATEDPTYTNCQTWTKWR